MTALPTHSGRRPEHCLSHFCNRIPHLTYPSCHCTKHNPNAIQPALTVVFCRPLVTLTVSLLHPLEIVSIFFCSMESKVKHLLSWGPFLQGQEKEDPHVLQMTFPLYIYHCDLWGFFPTCHCTWSLDRWLTTLVLPSWTKLLVVICSQASSCLSPSASSYLPKPTKLFWSFQQHPTSRVRHNLPPLSTPGMRSIDQQTSTPQLLSSSTTDIYLTTQKISTDTANNNSSLTVWGKFSTQTTLKTAHTHFQILPFHCKMTTNYILFHVHSFLPQATSLCSPCCRIIKSFQDSTSSPDIEQHKWSMFPATLKHLGWVERAR